MAPYWTKVSTILAGADAMRKATQYLPKFIHESDPDYDFRRLNSKFTNIFRDIVENLAAKPFSKEVALGAKATDRIKKLAENITGSGDHLHIFSANCFFHGIANAIDWILVDYTKNVPVNATIAQEQALGVRPYWVRVPAQNVRAAYSETIGGVETFVHIRIKEDTTERDGYGEKTIQRVRILNRELTRDEKGEVISAADATWQVMEKRKGANGKDEWVSVGEGPITIKEIPMVPFVTGRRIGNSWRIVPPLQGAADLQIEHYQQESGLKYAKELTCFPMLAGNGVTPDTGDDGAPRPVPVGPKSVLYAPANGEGQHGEWKFIEPSAQSLKFLAEDVKETGQQLRELGRQPLTAQTGNLTVVTTAFAAQKGNSAIQAWALNLKDALENALRLTALWLKEEIEAEVTVHTDFDVETDNVEGMKVVLDMKKEGLISRSAAVAEAKRRNILSPEYDDEEDMDKILEEVPGADGDEDITASATPPIDDPDDPALTQAA
ncbi:hypothetical protein C5748_18345 [Phyllobacterium phragmitis]|uniref:DUF4055 domain-containing protein n=2 Tax=Phyllobacterium phragmitis TaxID=2670329 RepID=A0A2S9INQ9_9HYPH|nr:hypothetical protein C5748_18345 [Phyllobacterium phragmitis]